MIALDDFWCNFEICPGGMEGSLLQSAAGARHCLNAMHKSHVLSFSHCLQWDVAMSPPSPSLWWLQPAPRRLCVFPPPSLRRRHPPMGSGDGGPPPEAGPGTTDAAGPPTAAHLTEFGRRRRLLDVRPRARFEHRPGAGPGLPWRVGAGVVQGGPESSACRGRRTSPSPSCGHRQGLWEGGSHRGGGGGQPGLFCCVLLVLACPTLH